MYFSPCQVLIVGTLHYKSTFRLMQEIMHISVLIEKNRLFTTDVTLLKMIAIKLAADLNLHCLLRINLF